MKKGGGDNKPIPELRISAISGDVEGGIGKDKEEKDGLVKEKAPGRMRKER